MTVTAALASLHFLMTLSNPQVFSFVCAMSLPWSVLSEIKTRLTHCHRSIEDRLWTLHENALLGDLVYTVNNLDVSGNFTFDTFVGFALHSAQFFELLRTLLDIFHRLANDLDILVLSKTIVDEATVSLVWLIKAARLRLLFCLQFLPTQSYIERQLLLE